MRVKVMDNTLVLSAECMDQVQQTGFFEAEGAREMSYKKMLHFVVAYRELHHREPPFRDPDPYVQQAGQWLNTRRKEWRGLDGLGTLAAKPRFARLHGSQARRDAHPRDPKGPPSLPWERRRFHYVCGVPRHSDPQRMGCACRGVPRQPEECRA